MIHSASQSERERERELLSDSFGQPNSQSERERESYWVNLNKDQRERGTFIILESHFQWDKERETKREKEREIRNTLSWALELSRSICDEGRDCDCDLRDCDCDLSSMICDLWWGASYGDDDNGRAIAMMTMGELRRPRSEYWGFGLVLPFWYRGSVLGVFFFLTNTVYFFWFVLLLLCKL